jgi:hypothetical protein
MAVTTGANGKIILSENRLLTPDNVFSRTSTANAIRRGGNVGRQGVIKITLTLAKAGFK